jgi:NTE family protein
MIKRALVLGGGGPIGVAWETGLAYGLDEAGFAFDSIDAVVGTSAGAIVGSQLAHGQLPPGPRPKRVQGQSEPGAGMAPRLAAYDMSKLDAQAMAQVFALWTAIAHTTAQEVAVIGKIASRLYRDSEAAWISDIEASLPLRGWPESPLLVCCTDTETGERRVFERSDGAPMTRVIAASSAVPGLSPSVEIQGRLYMDGQVHSSTNADVLVPHRPAQVLIAMPTNAATGRGIGPHAERMLEVEVAALQAIGSEVLVRTPHIDDTQRMGKNLMDYGRVRDAYAVGFEAGQAWAAELV